MIARHWGRLALLAVAATVTLLAGCRSAGPAPPAVIGYLVPWDSRSLQTAGDDGGTVLTEVSPVWYQPTDGGELTFASAEAEASVSAVSEQATSHGLAVIPTISNFRNGEWDGAVVATIIGDAGLRDAHIAAITGLVRSRGWAGVDLDYESLPAASRDDYSTFVRDLAAELHKTGAQLTVTVHAKTEEPGDFTGAQAQDWHALGAVADQVRVMAYDYSYSTSPPGPIAPRSWVEQVMALAVKEIPTDRIVLGLATYGYDWPQGKPGRDVQWADVQTIAQTRRVTPHWDSRSGSPWLTYTDDSGRPHTVWYENARSLAAKIDVAKRHGVNQVALWRLGGEDPGVWSALRAITTSD